KDKILANAKKGKFAGRSPMPIYIGITAAAAAVVVGGGTVMFMQFGGNKGVDLLTGSTLTALSNKERIERAIEDIRKNENSGELRDVMVTFREPLSPAEVQGVLTANAQGSVPVKMLYFSDESRVVGSEAVGKVFDKNEGKITGAVINCAGYLMEQLQKSSEVFTVEIMTAEDDLNVVAPIKLNDPEIVDIPPIDIGGDVSIDIPSEPEPVESTDISDSSDVSESSDISDSSDVSDNSDGESSEGGEDSEDNSDTTSDTPEKPAPVIDEMPEGVTLPENIEAIQLLTSEIYAKDAFFVNDDYFFVLTENGAAIYEFDGNSAYLESSIACEEPRIEWIAEDGSELLISAADDGRRTKLFYVNTQSNLFTELDVDGIVMTGIIKDVVYNKNSGMLVLNIDEDGDYYACTAAFDGNEVEYLAICYYSEGVPITVFAVNENYAYVCVQGENHTEIVKAPVDRYADEFLLFSEESSCAVSPNLAGTYGSIVLNSGSYIFDTVTETMLTVPASGVVNFGASANSFACGGGYYTINDGQISAASGLDTVAKIDWRSSLSAKYQAKVSENRVKITESLYSAKNLQMSLLFNSPYENATAEMREVLNRGIGLQNALATNKISASGFADAQSLVKAVKAIYTQSAVEQIRTRCQISGIELSYVSGGLGTINASDTVFTITANDGKNATGVLYIKVGTFDGKIGYRTVNVSLVNTGAQWKLNGIIE
ncbi:MAG: hypothetical protein ACI4JZ_02745, partial [Oscillospiraceae bacterium]